MSSVKVTTPRRPRRPAEDKPALWSSVSGTLHHVNSNMWANARREDLHSSTADGSSLALSRVLAKCSTSSPGPDPPKSYKLTLWDGFYFQQSPIKEEWCLWPLAFQGISHISQLEVDLLLEIPPSAQLPQRCRVERERQRAASCSGAGAGSLPAEKLCSCVTVRRPSLGSNVLAQQKLGCRVKWG